MPRQQRKSGTTRGAEWPLAAVLFVLFLVVAVPGVSWGTPEVWNPDELVGRVDLALGGEIEFDESEPDFNYPSLPKYVMYGLGRIVYGMGGDRSTFIVSSRVLSVLLGALAAVLVFALARRAGASLFAAFVSGLLFTASGVVPSNARFAHNDMYLQLFVILCVIFAVNFQKSGNRLWLYASSFAVGLAASSKYTGGSLLLLPLAVLLIFDWPRARRDWLGTAERLVLCLVLAFAGYVSGTPRALLWMSYYFKRVIPALLRYPQYGLQPNSTPGIIGQWSNFSGAVGAFLFWLFLVSGLWMAVRAARSTLAREPASGERSKTIVILLLSLVIFDLPFLVSVNYIPRYFIPFVPILSVLAGLFLDDLGDRLRQRFGAAGIRVALIVLAIGLAYSFVRVVSTTLLFANDARGPAGEYLYTLRPGTVIEYTLYPPVIPRARFAKARNYPIFLLKYPGDTVPTNKPYDYNSGEEGLLERGVDYLVIDSFTYSRFEDPYICESNPVECDFFDRLLSGETRYALLNRFEYRLPPYMPQVQVAAVNPTMSIYERRD